MERERESRGRCVHFIGRGQLQEEQGVGNVGAGCGCGGCWSERSVGLGWRLGATALTRGPRPSASEREGKEGSAGRPKRKEGAWPGRRKEGSGSGLARLAGQQAKRGEREKEIFFPFYFLKPDLKTNFQNKFEFI